MPVPSSMCYQSQKAHYERPTHNQQYPLYQHYNYTQFNMKRNHHNQRQYYPRKQRKQVSTQHFNSNVRIPSEHFNVTRSQFSIIKCLHHIETLQKGLPKTWANWKTNITSNLRLAFCNETTKTAIEEVSSKYFHDLLQLSIEHYQQTLSTTKEYLVNHSNQLPLTLYDSSIKLITKWCRNQLGSKLSDNTLATALSIIDKCYREQYAPPPTNETTNRVVCHTDKSLSITIPGNTEFVPTSNETELSNSTPCDAPQPNGEDEPPITTRPATATSKKQSKVDNTERFFMHADCYDEDDFFDNTNYQLPGSQSQPTSSQASQMSQSSMLSFTQSSQEATPSVVIHKLSMKETSRSIESSCVNTLLLGDLNWDKYIPPVSSSTYQMYVCSGKLTAFREILDKVKKKVKISNLILCISSNNFDCAHSVSLLRYLHSNLGNKFSQCKIFVCLAGICKSLTDDNARALEQINIALRSKSDKYILINPPENFATINGHIFKQNTRISFFKNLDSFLA